MVILIKYGVPQVSDFRKQNNQKRSKLPEKAVIAGGTSIFTYTLETKCAVCTLFFLRKNRQCYSYIVSQHHTVSTYFKILPVYFETPFK